MGTIPTVPSFPAGYAAQGAQLAGLCTAIQWLMTGRPLARLTQGSSQTLTTGAATAVTWDTKIIDRDSGWSSGANTKYTAQTPGYYLVSAAVSFASNGTGARLAWFEITTGSNNPAGSGIQTPYCRAAAAAVALVDGVAIKSLTPYLYVGDCVQVVAEQTSGGNLATAVSGTTPSFFTVLLASG